MSIQFMLLACVCASGLLAVEPTQPQAPAIPATAQAATAASVGSRIPLATAMRQPDGTAITLGQVLAGKPTVVVFYRGGWCPFCTRHLAGLGAIAPDLTAAGWQIVALAPDQPTVLAAAIAQGDDGVRRLSDADGTAMRAFGVAYHVDDATVATLKGYKIDLEAAAGNKHRLLPVPSVFLVTAEGEIRFVHANPDYKVRMDPQAILTAAKATPR